MARIEYINDNSGNLQETHGSDSRLNVSSRSDGRGYYNSRDESESYSLSFDDANATAGDFVVYLKNTKIDGKHLVLRSAGVNCEAADSTFKICTVTGTAGGGASKTPTNLNQGGVSKAASVTALATADSGVTPMSGLTEEFIIEHIGLSDAFINEKFTFNDQVRLGQGQAIAIQIDSAAATDVRAFGTIYFYFE